MTRERNFFLRMTSDVTHILILDNTIFRIRIPTQRKQTKKEMQILSKILPFSWQEQIQKIRLFKYYTEKDKRKVGQNGHH